MYAAKRDPTDEDGKEKILPRKSQAVYLSAYNVLNLWQEENKTTSFSEDTILAYFHEKAKVWKPSTLWGQFSMLKNVIMTNHNIDMGNYFKLIAFMKKQSKGYLPTKNKVFTTEEIQKFLNDAPDHEYLVMKVVAIFGMSGSCRCDEYSTITLDHINKQGKIYVVDITKSRKRQFTIDAKFHNIINRYHSLRPVKTTTNRFFLKYLYGKCYTQPIGINNFMRMPKHIATYLELSEASSYTAFSFPRSTAKILIEPIVKVITLRRHVRRKSSTDKDDYIIDSIKIERDIPPSPIFQVKSVPSSSGNVKRIKLEEENYCVITVKDNETQQPAKNVSQKEFTEIHIVFNLITLEYPIPNQIVNVIHNKNNRTIDRQFFIFY